MSHFRITKGGISVVNYVVLGKRTKKADTKYLHFSQDQMIIKKARHTV